MKHKNRTMTKKISFGVALFFALTLTFVGCEADKTVYDGPSYILFSDSAFVLPVQNSKDYFEIPISATQTAPYDRTLAVEIIDKQSNAIEGKHYQLESNTITIKAGERATKVKLRGIYENIGISDSIGVTLRLIINKNNQWKLYGTDTKVRLKKTCPFDINAFTGYCTVTSTYFSSYMPYLNLRLIKSKIDPENANGIILENYFYEGFDVKIGFDTSNPLHPLLKMKEQIFASTSEAFGTIYGDGKIRITQPSLYRSYYSTCEAFAFQYMTLHVPNVGTVGTFVNVIKWISDDEAAKLKREGY